MNEKTVIMTMPEVMERRKALPLLGWIEEEDDGDTEYRMILVARNSTRKASEKTAEKFRKEMRELLPEVYGRSSFRCISATAAPGRRAGAGLFADLAEAIPAGSEITVDISYGAGAMTDAIFSALGYAMGHLGCMVSGINCFVEGEESEEPCICGVPVSVLFSLVK